MNTNLKSHKRGRSFKTVFAVAMAMGVSLSTGGCGPKAKNTAVPTEVSPSEGSEALNEHKSTKAHGPYSIDDWWPNRLDLRVLRDNAPAGDPIDDSFNYAAAFAKLDMAALKADVKTALTTSQDWWPADYGHYGGLMIRLAWHSSGTYRATDGRGGAASGTIRFAPLNSWPDNANLDKARRLLWPVKKKYGRSLSWADLMVLSGTVALESMGFETYGFAGGRADVYDPMDINWGPETEWLADERFGDDGKSLKKPLGASQMGLIYVNPEGPNGVPDPALAAEHIRKTFARMGMNDEETVALIAGGHTLGKAHGAAMAAKHVGAEPEKASLEEQGLGWKNSYKSGKGADTITSGLEGAWTNTPDRWSQGFFKNLWEHEWVLTKSPGGAQQWTPKDAPETVPDAHDPNKRHRPMMLTTDLSLRVDPAYAKISKRFYENPKDFNKAFAKAWYKLTHRDMGPVSRLVGAKVPEAQLWQDPVPKVQHALVGSRQIKKLKTEVMNSGLTLSQLVRTAWASASTYRDTDKRGGANGARVRLSPQNSWQANSPADLEQVLAKLSGIQEKFNSSNKAIQISLADLIVLAGNTAVEEAAKRAGYPIEVPFSPGRSDASAEMTDPVSFAYLEPKSDGFRNYIGQGDERSAAKDLVEKADLLRLTAPEMTVLVGGLRVLDANFDGSKHGVFTSRKDTLSTDFFANLLDQSLLWKKGDGAYIASDRATGERRYTGTAIDLVFGSNSQLRAIAEVYAADDAGEKFVKDFASVWHKVMTLDRFELTK